MGAQVQSKTYYPGYNSKRGLNDDANSWSMSHEGTALSGHLYNGFVLRSLSGYSEHEKEMLKQTMLDHEAMFKKQVYDLHRLYRTQKNLMGEFQKKGLDRDLVQAETSQLNSFSQVSSESTKNIWQMPHLPALSTSYHMPPTIGTDDKSCPLKFLKESSMSSGHFPIENGPPLKALNLQDSHLEKFPKRLFDLQLPADAYIQNEDVDTKYIVPSNKIYTADPMNDVKLTLGIGECLSRQEDRCKFDGLTQNGLSVYQVADWDKSAGKMFRESSEGSAFTHFLSQKTDYAAQGNSLPMSSNTSFLNLRSAKDWFSVERSCSNFPHAAPDGTRQKWPLYRTDAGGRASLLSSGLHNENIPVSCGPVQSDSCEILSDKSDTWVGNQQAFGTDISRRIPYLAISNNSGPESAASRTPSSFPVVTNLNSTCNATPLVSISGKPLNVVQALPCFNGSVAGNVQRKRSGTMIEASKSICDSRQHKSDSGPHLSLGNEASSNGNGSDNHFEGNSSCASFTMLNLNSQNDIPPFFNCGNPGPQKRLKGLQCTSMKFTTDMCLKQSLQSGDRDDLIPQLDGGGSSLEGKCYPSSSGISWLTRKPILNETFDRNKCARMEFGFLQAYPKLVPGSNAMDSEQEWKREKARGTSLSNCQDFPSTSRAKNLRQGNEVSDKLSCKEILGFSILEKSHQNGKCLPLNLEQSMDDNTKVSEKDDLSFSALFCDIKKTSFEEKIHPLIDLNTSITEISHEGEMEDPTGIKMAGLDERVASEIDFEAPVASHSKENIISLEETTPPSKMDGSPDTECYDEELVRKAAANIVHMSLENGRSSDGFTIVPQSPELDTLQWFVGIVLSSAQRATISRSAGCSECPVDGLDHFELMTLQLEEIKFDDCSRRLREPDNWKEAEKAVTSEVLSDRGQARRRRPRRDFQKDVLPGLVSLSRREVNEDLQTIGGMIKASGRSSPTGLTRQKAGRNGLAMSARGRLRPKSLARNLSNIQISPVHPQNSVSGSELDGRTMVGWGRTTRRCRRQRCPPASISAFLNLKA